MKLGLKLGLGKGRKRAAYQAVNPDNSQMLNPDGSPAVNP